MFQNLEDTNRLLMEVELVPIQGDRFQPTGFADLGAATYRLADGTRKLLVESAQSMANRFEQTIVGPDNELIEELAGLSYICVQLSGASDAKTNSLLEAHRLNSPFIISDKNFQDEFKKAAEYEKNMPLNWRKIAHAFFRFDVNALLHGAFLANLEDGRIKMSRALSGFIEAEDVHEAVSGGVKFNPIDPTGKVRAQAFDKDVYGNVPYQRVEYTAGHIAAYFNLDLGLLRSYDLGPDAFNLLTALALYKVRAFLEAGTRLRTACDLKIEGELHITEPTGFDIPDKSSLLSYLQQMIQVCKSLFADPPVRVLSTQTVIKKSKSEETN